MGVRSVIYGRLAGYTALTALVSDRIYANVVAQNSAFPAVVYQVVDASYEPLNGYSNDGSLRTTMQIDCYATTYEGAEAVADQVRAALMDWHQDTSPIIWRVFHAGEADRLYESDTGLYGISIDFEVISPA